jgi:hypothetical protein
MHTSQETSTQTQRIEFTTQQVLKSQSQWSRCVFAESRRLRMFNGGFMLCSMPLGVPFIAPRQLGALGSPFGRQFLPFIGWRTGQSGAPPNMNSAQFLSFLGEADRWALGPLGTPDNPVRPSDRWLWPHVARWSALTTVDVGAVGSPDSLVNFSRSALGDSREQRVHPWANLGTGHYLMHTGQSGAPKADASVAVLSQTSPI